MSANWHYVYILRSFKDGKLYVGYTTDLKKRIFYHNEGLTTSTKSRRPLKLIYAEAYVNERDARIKEKFYKSGRGREVIKKILVNTFNSL
jgi:putative endonuclease